MLQTSYDDAELEPACADPRHTLPITGMGFSLTYCSSHMYSGRLVSIR